MPEVEEAVLVGIGLCDMKIGSDQWYQQGVKHIIQEFEKDLSTLLQIRVCHSGGKVRLRSRQPGHGSELQNISGEPCASVGLLPCAPGKQRAVTVTQICEVL